MGKRGPKPTPSATQKRLGTYRADKRPGEVSPPAALPPKPSWLDARSVKCWAKIAPLLYEHDLLTRLDAVALALLCSALADFILAREIVEKAEEETGTRFITQTDKGNIIQHPAVGVMNKAWEKVVKLCREFGMTPSARAGLAIANKQPPADPMTDLLTRIAAKRNN